MYQSIIKPLLFSQDPEKIHYKVFGGIRFAHRLPLIPALLNRNYNYVHPKLEKQVMGLNFKNPIGLAAGFDKDARLFNELGNMGFGFVEIGTLTPKAQDGNPKPRLFRLPEDKALINRMGFNNGGVVEAVERLKKRKTKTIIGGNIGKNKVTPNENALDDYLICFDQLFAYVDYFVVNVSSPNTPNLRALQDKEPLMKILNALQEKNSQKDQPKPILLKIAPDLTNGQLQDIVEIISESNIEGVIATNTTIDRSQLITPKSRVEEIGAGGLSGMPVQKRSTEIISFLRSKLPTKTIIGVGGIFSPEDALEKINAGADLIQVYTGYIYEGPKMLKRINKFLAKQL